jgi:hypothetical protein
MLWKGSGWRRGYFTLEKWTNGFMMVLRLPIKI